MMGAAIIDEADDIERLRINNLFNAQVWKMARDGSKEERERRWFLAFETLIGRESRLKQDGDRFERR